MEVVGLDAARRAPPAQLSGGQRQRVALARAIVKRPRLLLLDEPLSALDRKVRSSMQLELKRLQHEVGITFVVVTHDQEEAMSMADRIAVLRDGHLEQLDTPAGALRRPRHPVRRVVHRHGEPARRHRDGRPASTCPASARSRPRHSLAAGSPATAVVRPEDVELSADAATAPCAAPSSTPTSSAAPPRSPSRCPVSPRRSSRPCTARAGSRAAPTSACGSGGRRRSRWTRPRHPSTTTRPTSAQAAPRSPQEEVSA